MRVSFLVHGSPGGALDARVRGMTCGWEARHDVRVHHRGPRKVRAIGALCRALRADRPDLVCVVDAGFSGVLAAALHRALGRRRPLVLDTGDAIGALGRALGRTGLAATATDALEAIAQGLAARIIVRGTAHRDILRARGLLAVDVVPDGVDCERIRPVSREAARAALGLDEALTVGVLGSLTWTPLHGLVYGWDLVEALAAARDLPIRGLVVGDGDGLPRLRARAADLGVLERVEFLGRRPLEELPPILAAGDVWLSTQSNDLVGQVRTTGKLPLYMAAGRFVLATDVGEARRLLPAAMRLPYEGAYDPAWPARLAARLRALAADRAALDAGTSLRAVAERELDFRVLGPRYEAALLRALEGGR